MRNQLIIVEGLTGSGKSIMAHFVARQLQYQGLAADWVHEGETPHPVLVEVGDSIDEYMAEIRLRWLAYADQLKKSGQIRVVEAGFFNNMFESLMAHNLEKSNMLRFRDELQEILAPLAPALIYFFQDDLERSLEHNFMTRGDDFQKYVIRFTNTTPLAKHRGWQGYAGMLAFWRRFVDLTDELFESSVFRKLRINNSARDWEACNQQVLDFLGLPFTPEPGLPADEARAFTGLYRDENSGRAFSVRHQQGELSIGLFLDVRSRLIPRGDREFWAQGWPFEISFETGPSGVVSAMRIGGREVDYLPLVGTFASRESAESA